MLQQRLTTDLTNTRLDLATVNGSLRNVENAVTKVKADINTLNTRLAELEERLNFTTFKTLTELTEWLKWDNTSAYEYIPRTFDCDDFAFTLMVHAFSSGYKMGTAIVYLSDTLWYIYYGGEYYWKAPLSYHTSGYWIFGNHMANLAYVETIGWVLIEPQTDAVYPLDTYEL